MLKYSLLILLMVSLIVQKIKRAYYSQGLLFLWMDEEREWGYFVSFGNHNFCNVSEVDSKGNYTKHRRKTPEPPQDLLQEYLESFPTS